MNHLSAGTARCDVTPAPGTPQGGWGAQIHQRGIGADMPLYATALVVSDSNTTIAIVDIDSTGFYDSEWIARTISEVSELTGISPARIRLSYSHTHSGPNTYRLRILSEGLDLILAYLQDLPHRIAGAVWQAKQSLKPVRMAAGAGSCAININRRILLPDGRLVVGKNPDGPVDHTVRVVHFDDWNGNAVATIVHYACHPTIVGWQTQQFTPDYPGIVRQVVEREVGGTCLFLQGAAGNIGPIDGFTGDLRVYRRLGKWLGLEASRVAIQLETTSRRERCIGVQTSGAPIALYEYEPPDTTPPVFKVRNRILRLPFKPFRPLGELEAELQAKVEELNRLREQGAAEEKIRLANALAAQADDDVQEARLSQGKVYLEWPLQGIRIGSVALVAMPGEPTIELNQHILAQSPFEHTLFSGYSNGPFGYLPARETYREGGYEVEGSLFSPEAPHIVVEESLGLLRDLAGDCA